MLNHSKQNNGIPGAAPTRHRRRGQALLLAVLLMVFVALLGSTFISVVALNLNQTARQGDQTLARGAAQAGVDFVNEQLVNSDPGVRWRPEMAGLPPAPGAPDYNFYYSALERAQGWARTTPAWNASDTVPNWSIAGDWDRDGALDPIKDEWAKLEYDKRVNNAPVYVKFPDPRIASGSNQTTFLAEVKPFDAGDKRGQLQISIIGVTDDNPNVFERRVGFKNGPGQGALTAAARSVTNWDFANQTVPSAQIEADVLVPATALVLKEIKGRFPLQGFYVVIGDAGSNSVRGAVVTAFDAATRTLSLAAPITARAGERIEMAAGLGAPTRLDFNADGARTATTEDMNFSFSASATPGGVRVNGGLVWFGSALSNNLRSSQLDAVTTPAASIRASGLMCYDNGATDPTTMKINNAVYQSQSAAQSTLSSGTLASSSAAPEFPGAWMDAGGQALSAGEKAQLVDDGGNRIAGNAGAERQTRPFTPPDIVGGDVGRYRRLSRFSPPLASTDAGASFYGYGEGIYIDNGLDKERIFDSATSRLRDMRQDELRQLWLNPTAATNYFRLGTPVAATNPNASMEEQHLRGWIAADEFRARGALIEIVDVDANGVALAEPKIVITRDARGDGASANANGVIPNQGPLADKGWRDESGARRGQSTLGGVYRWEFAWPKNGAIFAEGNLRVRGSGRNATNVPRSLTIVSMNNIYIEGSLNAGRRKVLLLARKNVVLNPTGVVARVDAQTRVEGSTNVYDPEAFRVGEYVEVVGGTPPVRKVTAVMPGSSPNITLEPALAEPANTSPIVRSRGDALNSGLAPTNVGALQGFDDVLQRRFTSGAAGTRVALRHGADRVTAFTLGADESSPPSNPDPLLGIKVVPTPAVPTPGPPSMIVRPANKILEVSYTGGNPGTDRYPAPPPTTQSAWVANTISAVRTRMLLDRPASSMPPYSWSYTSPTPTGYQNLPYFFLAGVGNRFNGVDGVAPNNERRPNLITSDYDIPLATSVTLAVDGANRTLRGDRWNTSLGAGGEFERVPQFGFNPTHGAPADNADLWEDALTVDQSFYSSNPNQTTLDSRVLEGVGAGLHSLVLQFSRGSGIAGDPTIASYFSGAENPPQYRTLPNYRLSRLKLENADQLNAAPDYQFEKLAPGHTIDVNAFVYAQEGSWIVLSAGEFDSQIKSRPNIRGTYLDANNNDAADAGEYLDVAPIGTFGDGDFADLDRDGVISHAEQVAVYRYRRYNYQINFTGAITENQSTLVRDPDGTGPLIGGVANWMDSWSTFSIDAANWNGTGSAATFNDTLRFASGFGNIAYSFDDSALKGFFDLNGNNTPDPGEELSSDTGFNTPVSSELIYQ